MGGYPIIHGPPGACQTRQLRTFSPRWRLDISPNSAFAFLNLRCTDASVIALWQPALVFAVFKIEVFSRAVEYIGRDRQVEPHPPSAGERTDSDLPHLGVLHTTRGIISACFHMTSIFSYLLLKMSPPPAYSSQ